MQHLLDRGLGVAGVAIDPAPTPGVMLGPHAIVSAWPVLGDPFSGGKVKAMSREFFDKRFFQRPTRRVQGLPLRPLHHPDGRQGVLGRRLRRRRRQ